MPPQQPGSPNPQYDFIMGNGQKPKRKLVPSLGLPRPVKFGIAGALFLIVLIILSSLVSGHKKTSGQPLVNIMAQAQEISRVSAVVNQESTDASTQALASTVSATLDSQEARLSNYLTSSGQKIDAKSLGADQNSNTDAQLQSASQNNNLEPAYASYLTQSLASYKTALSGEYKSAGNSKLKAILNDSYNSVQTLLNTSPLSK